MRLQSQLIRPFTTILVLFAAVLSSGCRAHRTLEIRTNPPGAEIVLDQDSLGPSPAKIEFYHYGARRISASLPSYHIFSERIEIQPPWYARFPLDLFSEVFFPIGWTDHHVITIDLTKGSDQIQAPDIRSVLERAEVLRRAGPDGVKELPEVRVVSIGSGVSSDTEESESEIPQP
ncbi:MAG: hypothetical protein ACI8TQ_001276 [Planctomycetota bacterium]|jgi:hypothetical protein